jgi:hypothetical protein
MKGHAMTETLQEYCDSRGTAMRVDARAGVIHGVKLLGLESRNGRSYLPEALVEAARLYEDAKVNVNHPKGHPASPRDYQDRIGSIRGVVMRPGEGLFGDLHFNPKHALAEQLVWDAEHAPENVGFSHNVEARTSRRGDRVVVEAITRVQSVDLVADPATTRGLFESCGAKGDSIPLGAGGKGDSPIFADATIGTVPDAPLTLDDLKRDHPELFESIARQQADELGRLQKEVERLTELETAHQKRNAARRLLREFDLPDPETDDPWAKTLCGGLFFEMLLGARDEPAMRELVEERARLVQRLSSGAESRPQSRDQHRVYGVEPLGAKSFVEAISGEIAHGAREQKSPRRERRG